MQSMPSSSSVELKVKDNLIKMTNMFLYIEIRSFAHILLLECYHPKCIFLKISSMKCGKNSHFAFQILLLKELKYTFYISSCQLNMKLFLFLCLL